VPDGHRHRRSLAPRHPNRTTRGRTPVQPGAAGQPRDGAAGHHGATAVGSRPRLDRRQAFVFPAPGAAQPRRERQCAGSGGRRDRKREALERGDRSTARPRGGRAGRGAWRVDRERWPWR